MSYDERRAAQRAGFRAAFGGRGVVSPELDTARTLLSEAFQRASEEVGDGPDRRIRLWELWNIDARYTSVRAAAKSLAAAARAHNADGAGVIDPLDDRC